MNNKCKVRISIRAFTTFSVAASSGLSKKSNEIKKITNIIYTNLISLFRFVFSVHLSYQKKLFGQFLRRRFKTNPTHLHWDTFFCDMLQQQTQQQQQQPRIASKRKRESGMSLISISIPITVQNTNVRYLRSLAGANRLQISCTKSLNNQSLSG